MTYAHLIPSQAPNKERKKEKEKKRERKKAPEDRPRQKATSGTHCKPIVFFFSCSLIATKKDSPSLFLPCEFSLSFSSRDDDLLLSSFSLSRLPSFFIILDKQEGDGGLIYILKTRLLFEQNVLFLPNSAA